MIVKRPALTRALALLALFSVALTSTVSLALECQATAGSTKKSKRKHRHSHTNMSLVPPPPPTIAIPEGMLLAVPPPPILSAGFSPTQAAFNPYQSAMPGQQSAHRCGHCGFSDSTYLAPTMPNSSPFYRPFPRRTFYNADSMTTMSVSRSRKTRSERLTKRFKKRKCIFANR